MPIEIMMNGSDLDSLLALSARAQGNGGCSGLCGNNGFRRSWQPGGESGSKPAANGRFGLAMAQVGLTLQTAFSGNTDAKYRDGDYEYPIPHRPGCVRPPKRGRHPESLFCKPTWQYGVPQAVCECTGRFGPRTPGAPQPRLTSVMLSAQVIGGPMAV